MRLYLMWLIVVVSLTAPLAYCAVRIGFEVIYGIDDAYAQWGAADMLIDYMEDHESSWPKSWGDMSPYFTVSNGRVAGWSYAKIQQPIWIDFDSNGQELIDLSLDSDGATFNVIGAKYSNTVFGVGPNQQIHDYLRAR